MYFRDMIWAVLFLDSVSQSLAQRPIWNIGHMVNNKNQIDEFLNLGANGVETDIKFADDGTALFMSHGFPCDCGRDCFRWEYVGDYLDYVAELTSTDSPRYRPEFVLICLDLKLKSFGTPAKTRALTHLARLLTRHLWKNGTSQTVVNILIHLPNTEGLEAVKGFYEQLTADGMDKMSPKIGWEVYSDESIQLIRDLWVDLKLPTNTWQGDGITNCLPRSSRRLAEAVTVRETANTIFSKVYYWTVDRRSTMRNTLRMGVDALMTNYPNRLVEILQEPEIQKLARLATIKDDPFQKYVADVTSTRRMVELPEFFFNREEDDSNNTIIF